MGRPCPAPEANFYEYSTEQKQISICAPKPKTFFHYLTDDALESVIRFLSSEPRGNDWISHIDPKDVQSLLGCEETLAPCARRIFCRLEYHTQPPKKAKGIVVVGERKESKRFFCTLASSISAGLEEIHISGPLGKRHKRFLDNCPNIRTVSLSEGDSPSGAIPFNYIVNATKASAKHLKISRTYLHIMGSEELLISSVPLKSLTLQVGKTALDQRKLWSSLGDYLEELSLGCRQFKHNPFKLSDIEEYCRRITKLEFEDFPEHAEKSIANLCVSYRAQLRSLRLYSCGINPRYLRRIADGCQNVNLDFSEWADKCVRALVEVGPLISALEIFDKPYDAESVKMTVGNLHNLTQVVWNSYFGVHFSRFRHFLLQSRSNLVAVHICFRGQLDENAQESIDDIFQLLAGPTTVLEEFTYECPLLPTHGVLNRFLVSNTQLRKLRFEGFDCICSTASWQLDPMRNAPCRKSLLAKYCKMVSAALRVPRLKELRMSCRFSSGRISARVLEIANICVPARKRDICVTICGFIYS